MLMDILLIKEQYKYPLFKEKSPSVYKSQPAKINAKTEVIGRIITN